MLKRFLLLALTASCASLFGVVLPVCAAPSTASRKEKHVNSVTVPMDLSGHRPHVTLTIVGPKGVKTRARFVVDTAGASFFVTNELAQKAGWKPDGPVTKGKGVVFAPFTPDHVRLGGMRLDLKGVRAAILIGRRWIYSGDASEGVLPAQVLSRYDVAFNYPNKRFTLARPRSLKHFGMRQPFQTKGPLHFPRIECRVRRRYYHFLLDTGGTYSAISRALLKRWLEADRYMRHETGAAGPANMTGGPMETKALVLRLRDLDWVGFHVRAAGIVSRPEDTYDGWMSKMTAGPVVGCLGGNILKDFRFEIDYADRMIYVQRLRDSRHDDMDRVGLILKIDPDGSYEVTGTASDTGRRLRKSVHKGDILTDVNGRHVKGMGRASLNALLAGRPGTHKILRFSRHGKSLRIRARVSRLT